MMVANDDYTLALQSVETGPLVDGAEVVVLHTNGGPIDCRFHSAATGDAAVLWVFGGGLGGGWGPRGPRRWPLPPAGRAARARRRELAAPGLSPAGGADPLCARCARWDCLPRHPG